MPSPYRGRGPRRVAHERQSTLGTLLARLAILGATDDELEAFRVSWADDTPPDWTEEHRQQMAHTSDPELRALILSARDEYREARPLEDEPPAGLVEEARMVVAGGVRGVFVWVGRDAVRARAILDLELGVGGAGRKSLVARLQPIAAGGDET